MFFRTSLLSALFLLFFTSCIEKNKPPYTYQAIISGQVLHDTSSAQIKLTSYLNEIAGDTKTYADKNGNFKFVLQIPIELEFSLLYNNSHANFLLSPGDSVFVIIDLKKTPSFTFSGENSQLKNELYYLNKTVSASKITDTALFQRYKEENLEQYQKYRTKLYYKNLSLLKEILGKEGASKKARKYFESKYLVDYGFELIHFLSMSSIYQSFRVDKENIPDSYIKTLDSLFVENISNMSPYNYHNFINLYSQMLFFDGRDSMITAIKNRDRLLAAKIQMDYDLNKFSGFQKDYLLTFSINNLIENSYINDETFLKYQSEITTPIFKSFLKKKHKEYKLLQNEELDTSKINFIDISLSDTISLFKTIEKNHKGKLLYVDVWGTWCGSCVSKFSYLPELRETLKNRNIEFLFLAVSSPEKYWKKTIKSHKVEGFHYLLNNKQKKELYNHVDISSIPHYFIIDQKGAIVIPDAKAPNNSQIIMQLTSLQ